MQAFEMAMTVLGGLALFLYGMEALTDALKAAAGSKLRRMLTTLTTNRLASAGTGVAVTAVVQSSSVTSVLVIGFVTAGLMSLEQALGVVLGAKLGTTITAQIIAFKVTHYALAMIAIGFLMHFVIKREYLRQVGMMILGLGLVFFGMSLMKDATKPLRESAFFIDAMQRMDTAVLGVLVGAVFTAIIQSSSAAIGIVIVLASQGLVTLEAGIALALGANIGTGITSILASIGKPREAVRVALFHIGFAALSVFAWLPFLPLLGRLATIISPGDDLPRQLANAVTGFNAVNLVLFVGFVPLFARLLRRVLPDCARPEAVGIQPRFLETEFLDTPAVAIDAARREIARMGDLVVTMWREVPAVLAEEHAAARANIVAAEEDVDRLQVAVLAYLRMLAQEDLGQAAARQVSLLTSIATYIENASDHIDGEVATAGGHFQAKGLVMSDVTRAHFTELHRVIGRALEVAVSCVHFTSDEGIAAVDTLKQDMKTAIAELDAHLGARLTSDAPDRLETFRLESDLVEQLRHVYYLARRMARTTRHLDRR